MDGVVVRAERAGDAGAIAEVTRAAFLGHPHSRGAEAGIVAGLREAGALVVSLVGERDGEIVGHVAFSPVRVSDGSAGWFGLGPVSVRPALQGAGVGSALVRAGLAALRARGAAGCVVLGPPGFYGRFGFAVVEGLVLPGAPAGLFQAVGFGGAMARGAVSYAAAFG